MSYVIARAKPGKRERGARREAMYEGATLRGAALFLRPPTQE